MMWVHVHFKRRKEGTNRENKFSLSKEGERKEILLCESNHYAVVNMFPSLRRNTSGSKVTTILREGKERKKDQNSGKLLCKILSLFSCPSTPPSFLFDSVWRVLHRSYSILASYYFLFVAITSGIFVCL